MIRVLLYLVLTIFVITLLRSILGMVVRGAGDLLVADTANWPTFQQHGNAHAGLSTRGGWSDC